MEMAASSGKKKATKTHRDWRLEAPFKEPLKQRTRSSLTTGQRTLVGVHASAFWSRVMRSVMDALTAHLGGESYMTEPQRLLVRRVSFIECELVAMESKFVQLREAGKQPSHTALTRYTMMTGTQSRLLTSIGLKRVPRDVTDVDPLRFAQSYKEREDA